MFFLAWMMMSLASAAWADGTAACRNVEGLRLDHASQLRTASAICTASLGIGVFTEGVREITLPNLRSAGVLNIEADDLEAVSFPNLTEARIVRISGGDLTVAELPRLKHVEVLYVKGKNLRFLHLPSLRTVGRFIVERNPNLEFIFADKLYDIRELRLEGNPKLPQGTAAVLHGVTQNLSEAELAQINNAEAEMRAWKIRLNESMQSPPPPPTGHPVFFDSFGIGGYYNAYPGAFWNYWNLIGPWHYQSYYGGPWHW